ncbi:MAG: Ig-like domain-containing protein [Coriobacteriia bacterium]
MFARVRVLVMVCLVSAASFLALDAAPAFALSAPDAAPDVVCGVVVSLEPRVVGETGVIVTDVRVVESRAVGGTELTGFTMEGGEVGEIGMWSEQYTDLRVGDPVIVGVTEKDGELAAVMAPIAKADRVAAGYVLDGIHWADEDLPFRFYVNPDGLPVGAASAITAAAQTWEDDSGSYMDYTYMGPTSAAPGARDGIFVIGSGSFGSSSAVGQCRSWYYTSTHHFIESDITFNTGAYTFATDGSRSSYDVQVVSTHELGHTLRLMDMYDAENLQEVMYGRGSTGDTSHRTLGWGDIAGIRAIYPVPVALADVATVAEDTTLSVAAPGVLGNDTDVDGDALRAGLVTGVAHGTLALRADGSYTYRPAADFNGTDSFTYRAYDGVAYSVPVNVAIAVTPVNDAPVSSADTATIAEDGMLSVAAPGILGNDTDVDGDALRASVVTGTTHGTLQLVADGSYTYRPSPDFRGTDSFTYRAFDGAAYSAPARVTIAVRAVNDAPVAVADEVTAAEDTTLSVAAPGVLGNDTDVDGDALSSVAVAGVTHGTLALAADGSYTYVPAPDFRGVDSFTYRVFDGAAYSTPVTVTITVARLDPCTIDVSSVSSASLGFGSTFVVEGTLRSGGGGLLGQRVILQSAAPGASFRDTSNEATTGADGLFSLSVRPASRTYYRVRFPGSNGYAAALSTASVYALPCTYVGVPVAPVTMSRTANSTVWGWLKPRHAAGSYPVRIYKWKRTPSGGWTSYGYVSARASDYSTYTKYSISLKLPTAGTWRLQACAPADSGHASAWSSGYDYVTVR